MNMGAYIRGKTGNEKRVHVSIRSNVRQLGSSRSFPEPHGKRSFSTNREGVAGYRFTNPVN